MNTPHKKVEISAPDEGKGLKRTWTAHATIQLEGTGKSYTPPGWPMSGPLPPAAGSDRQKAIKEYIEQTWLDNGAIWKLLGINAAEQDQWCQTGGTFRVDYGFDKRPKEWQFSKFSKPNCKCTGGMTFI